MDTQQVKVLATAPTDTSYNGYGDCMILNALSNVNANIKDAESGVKERISISDNQRQVAELNLHNRLCEAEKAAIEAKFEGRLETKEAVEKLSSKIAHGFEELSEEVTEFKEEVMEKFCDIEKTRLQDEIDELRQAKVDGTNDGILSTLNAILAKIK